MKSVKMTLCSKCKEKIEKRAKVCPHCQAKRTNPKLALFLGIIGLLWAIADGCSALGK
ncbi:MAG: zinc ribbon domain-containing protein [Brevinema sp.]